MRITFWTLRDDDTRLKTEYKKIFGKLWIKTTSISGLSEKKTGITTSYRVAKRMIMSYFDVYTIFSDDKDLTELDLICDKIVEKLNKKVCYGKRRRRRR